MDLSNLSDSISKSMESLTRPALSEINLRDPYGKVNRLIIVGNGFDLAHGLKSSFSDFLNAYCNDILRDIVFNQEYDSPLIQVISREPFRDSEEFDSKFKRINGMADLNLMMNRRGIGAKWKSDFFKSLLQQIEIKKWVDIEIVFFDFLKKLSNPGHPDGISKLNVELDFLKKKLKEYLIIEVKGIEFEAHHQIHEQFTRIIDKDDCKTNTIKESKPADAICVLNFNYSDLVWRYFESFNKSTWQHIPIHGQLSGDDITSQGPVFGFGDELDKDYLEFEHQRNDAVFEHIKSFKYLQFNHYRNLLEFIESEPYQVQIFGHSCGVSDRTLLNTIFENENCISVKPFYHAWEGGDDYEQKSFAISRHFKSKAELRAKVVNKQYCEPMSQPKKEE